MRIICDAPDQTCNRLWTYVALAAQCIAEQKIIFRPIDEIIQKIERITRNLRKGSDILVRVNIWRQCMTDGTIIPSMSFTHPCNR